MSVHSVTGEAWNCPHCGEHILRSAVTCPVCQRHLRLDALTVGRPLRAVVCPLSVDGTIRHPGTDAAWEYSVLVEVHDGQGEMIARRVVGVGALGPEEIRRFTVRVEMYIAEHSALRAAS